PEPIPEAELSVRNHSLSFDYAGQFLGYDTFEIESDAEWRIEAVDAESEQWIAFDKLQGKNSDRVRVRVPPPIPVR
ncbi:MAG: hypothetical protein LUD68_00670, partial [Rikenellaceae bacterium]|nr:hypothetical protein [Rikenellaceae bacterium]